MKRIIAEWTLLATVLILSACSTSGVTAVPVNPLTEVVSQTTVPVENAEYSTLTVPLNINLLPSDAWRLLMYRPAHELFMAGPL